ncbi:precorrin-2 C(20)-methyltransferase [Parendozoicomonas haliclonae]|uniref:Cobalt-precorrin-2 C(20)-methyltransferase n=1 Tax=Parendozoicomonas haliclonae TaxID=1960125 RepID=A0A1X7ALG2_9GAMM|nr:precorrin-2 C(20)-methyltransferase [Parendozoicomonas haliclonae]SMA48830.1 Cobalt-precorrin-2 C(20)-methyltransferase [Parendozoicomonas haliclonae]
MSENKFGKLYAVGVGTGAPDLMTLRAINLLKTVDVIAIPEKNPGARDSFAWEIITGALQEEEMQGERLFLWFPMTKDASITVPAWTAAADAIDECIKAGKSVAFVTEGDPSVYSTWHYILDEKDERWPTVEVEVVPGITSITAVPAATGIPLAEGEERFCVVPATYGINMLPRLAEEFDTIMLIKAGRMVEELKAMLTKLNLLDKATYVSHALMDKQEIYPLDQVPAENRYFSMVQISIRQRKGVLRTGISKND